MPTFNYTTPGTYTVSVPNNGYNITLTVRGARGGRGGRDAEAVGGEGGTTTIQSFNVLTNYQARTFTLYVGGRGGNGEDNQPNASGGSRGSSGIGRGGRGGNAGDPPYSGGGGGGGGASGVAINGTMVVCMGGSGGGGGASDNRNGGGGGVQSVNASAASSVTPTDGGQGGDPGGTDGGGGGGGGGGDNGGSGGGPGRDNDRGGGGGGRGESRFNSNFVGTSGSPNSGQTSRDGRVQISWTNAPPTISSFTASPNPQNSTGGTRRYNTTLSWGTTFADTVTLTSSAGESWNESASGSRNITNLPQTTYSSNSPRTRTYTLTASNSTSSVSRSVTVTVRNDNFPSNSWTTSFTNLDPSTQQTLTLGTLAGVDMPCTISVAGSGNFIGNGGSFTSSRNFNNGDTVQLRTNSLAYNTDLTGVGSNATFGKTNTKTVTVTTPSGSFNVNVITKAPRIKEVFDYDDNVGKYPYEDIDLISNTPTEYVTSAQIEADDIDIPMEVKVDQPDAQVRINSGSWQNVREI